MRISDQQVLALTQYQLNSAYDQMAQAQTVLATDKKINTPADDPIGATTALELQGNLSQLDQFAATASDALSWLQTTDSAYGGVGDALQQARTLAVQGANATLTPDERQAIATNVGQLLQQAVQSANTSYSGRYVLAGYQTNKQPFTIANGAVTYQGDSGAMQQEIGPGQMMQVNMPGTIALPAVFSAMTQLQKDLQSGNTAAIGGADLQAIDDAHSGLLQAQTTVGASTNRLQAMQQTIQSRQTTVKGQVSQIMDADMAQAAIDFSSRQATYQAALSAASKVIQPSLLEFLK
jgi:flagellar hook-associated protein 3 FlgL